VTEENYPVFDPIASECSKGCIQGTPCRIVCIMEDGGEAELEPGYFKRRIVNGS
jgi:hypothetical protein